MIHLHQNYLGSGFFERPHVMRFQGLWPEKEKTRNFKTSNLTDFVTQIVYVGVLDFTDFKFLSWAYSFTVILALFVKNISQRGRAVSPSTPEHPAVELSTPINLSVVGFALKIFNIRTEFLQPEDAKFSPQTLKFEIFN